MAVITLDYFIDIINSCIYDRITGEYNAILELWTWRIIPTVFLLVFCVLLLVALVWICHSLKHDKHLMGNEKWMGAHTVLLTGVLGSYIWAHYFALNYTAYKIYGVVNTLCYILMAFIMDQVNGPQSSVHRVGK